MRIGDLLYFAPNIQFNQVDLNGSDWPEYFSKRIAGFYIQPAEECVKCNHAFAAGLLLVSCIDALARFRFDIKVKQRFNKFVGEYLKSFQSDQIATRFYSEFRNGLVHEARLKEGGQFSLQIQSTVEEINGILLVNPHLLAREVRKALDEYVNLLKSDENERAKLAQTLEKDLQKDFSFANA